MAKQEEKKHQEKKPRKPSKLIRYFRETGEELRKTTWPDREETTRLSLIVLGSTIVSAAVLGLFDLLFQTLMGLLV